MNKKNVADFLGVGVRAVERYMEQGKLSATYQRGKTRPVAVFDETEVKMFKKELDNPDEPFRPSIAPPLTTTNKALAVIPLKSERDLAAFSGILAEAINTAVQRSKDAAAPSIADLAAKPLLTISEAQRLSSLSRQTLLKAKDEGKLTCLIIGRKYKIKNKDLMRFIDKL